MASRLARSLPCLEVPLHLPWIDAIQRLKALRGEQADPQTRSRIHAVKRWQTQRLMRTYADLSANPRYRAATSYFVEDLYGPKDFSSRDIALLRIVPVMVRILPSKAVETASLSIEVEALSEDLDHRLAAALGGAPVERLPGRVQLAVVRFGIAGRGLGARTPLLQFRHRLLLGRAQQELLRGRVHRGRAVGSLDDLETAEPE